MADIIKATITNLSADIKTAKVINKLGDSAVTSVAGRVGDVVLTRYDVGLGNVNNTSDLNKPISTATQAALDLKSDVGHGHIFSEITGLGTAATADTGDFATFSQGVLADSALQPEDIDTLAELNSIVTDATLLSSAYINANFQPLDAILTNTTASFQTADETKLDYITVTQPVDLDAIEAASGDMFSAIYDPTNVSGDAFAMDNMVEGADTKILTSGERDKLAGIADGAEINVNADWNAVGGDAEILNKPAFGDITGSNIADFATSGQGALADTAIQSGDNVSLLTNDAGYLTSLGSYSYRAETGNYTVAGTDYTINCISGAQTITLPTAVGIEGQVFVVKNSSTGVITITGTASQTIDGYDSIETDFPQSLTLQSTNTNWIII